MRLQDKMLELHYELQDLVTDIQMNDTQGIDGECADELQNLIDEYLDIDFEDKVKDVKDCIYKDED